MKEEKEGKEAENAKQAAEILTLKDQLTFKEHELAAVRSDIGGRGDIGSGGGSNQSTSQRNADGWGNEEEEGEEEEEETGGDEAHTAELPPALRDFKILTDHPAVAAHITGEGDVRRRRLENAVVHNPFNDAAVAELATYVHELQAATQTAIDESLAEPGLFKRAFEAMVAGNNTFIEVYQSAVLEMLLELEAEGVINIVRLKDRFCTVPSGGGWRDLMVNMTIVGDATNHICELQVVHTNMLTAREGLPGHAVYNRVRNAVELLGQKFGGAGAAGDALALAEVLVKMGGGDAVGKEGGAASRESWTTNSFGSDTSMHRDHISDKDVFLADKGWLSDAPLKEWLGVRVTKILAE